MARGNAMALQRATSLFVKLWLVLVMVVPIVGLGSVEAAEAAIIGTTTRVSVDSSGAQGDGSSGLGLSMSTDGRFVAFYSSASNLVAGDTNNNIDAFVHDRNTGITTRVNVSSSGAQDERGVGGDLGISISADGRYVAFCSPASNLVAGDTNGAIDVFVNDRTTGDTTRVNVSSDGEQTEHGVSFGAALSADGRYVAFYSPASNLVAGDINGEWDVFLHDRVTARTTLVSVASSGAHSNGPSIGPGTLSVSADGRYVAFSSYASNLVVGDTNESPDVFVHDRVTGATTRVSMDSDDAQANRGAEASLPVSVSADGRYVSFASNASNLVTGDTNNATDAFVRDRATGNTARVSVGSDGEQGSSATFCASSISADGRYVAFCSDASNLVTGDTNDAADTFVHDRMTGTTSRASLGALGAQGNGWSGLNASISADGRYVAFASEASNLVPGDSNGAGDVFVRDRAITRPVGWPSAPPRRAIYYIPGFLASELFDSKGYRVWYDTDRVLNESNWCTDILALGPNGTGPMDAGQSVSINRTWDDFGTKDEGETIIRRLQEEFPDVAVEFFAWDWRRDVKEAAALLRADMVAKGYTEVDIVTHSTGGLVAAAYLAESDANVRRTRRLVTIASPTYGTFPSLYSLETGRMYGWDWNTILGNVFLDREWIKKSLRNAPCAYQLWPSSEYLKYKPMYVKRLVGPDTPIEQAGQLYSLYRRNGTDLNQALIDDSPRSHLAFRRDTLKGSVSTQFAKVESLHLGAVGTNTIVSTKFSEFGQLSTGFSDFVVNKAGDGTVPLYSALTGRMSAGRNKRQLYLRYLNVSHGGMQKNSVPLNDMVKFLRGEYSVQNSSASIQKVSVEGAEQLPTMADLRKYRFADAPGSAHTTKTVEVVRESDGQAVAWANADGAEGWDDEQFSCYFLDAEETGIIVYVPADGYEVVLRAATNTNDTESRVKTSLDAIESEEADNSSVVGSISALDDEGAYVSSASFEASATFETLTVDASGLDDDALGQTIVTLAGGSGGSGTVDDVTFNDDYVTQLGIAASDTEILLGHNRQFDAATVPLGAGVVWSSVDTDVVQVSDTGLVTAVGYGFGTVTASSADGNKSDSVEVTVPYDAESIALNCADPYIEVGEQRAVIASFTPEYATNRDLQFSSDSPGVASVDSDGVVTGISTGLATITATSSNGLTATTDAYVCDPPVRVNGVAFDGAGRVVMRPNRTEAVSAHAIPLGATWPELSWESSDPGVLSIETTSTSDAAVIGRISGMATLTATSLDGGFTASREIVVDGLAPTVVCEPMGTYADSASISIAAVDNHGGAGLSMLNYKIDGGPTVTSAGPNAVAHVTTLGSHVLTAWASDGVGNESVPITRMFSVTSATILFLKPSSTAPNHASSVTLSATLVKADGSKVPDQPVLFERWTGSQWVSVGSAATTPDGVATIRVLPIESAKVVYRATFAGVDALLGSQSANVTIVPKVSLGTPSAPKTMKHSKSYTIHGSLRPAHARGSKPVRIYKYKKVGKKWKPMGYVKATASNYKGYTRYSVKMKLTSKGSWRLRACAPTDALHARTWSAKYDTVTVK